MCKNLYSINVTLRAFTLVCLNFSVYFSIRTFFFFFTQSLLKKHTLNHILYTLFYLNNLFYSFFSFTLSLSLSLSLSLKSKIYLAFHATCLSLFATVVIVSSSSSSSSSSSLLYNMGLMISLWIYI